uniref:Putative soluble epoxide hydrolase n=1 Tax=Triatoma infestans TaxID=30076 RepID=A0A023F7J8_TRIIF
MKNFDIVKISTLDVITLKLYSLFWGSLFLIKQLLKNLWVTNLKENSSGNPPGCLIDNTLGQHSYIKLKEVKLHYIEAGEKRHPLVIMLHGFPDCWISWHYQIPVLAKHFRVIAMDMKGFGDSDKPRSRSSYEVKKLAKEFNDLIAKLGCRRCIIIGHDIGALFGWFIVHMYPEIVEKFVAISAPHPNLYWSTLPSTGEFNSRWVQFCQLPELPEIKALDGDLVILNNVYTHLVKDSGKQEYLDAYKYAFARKEDWTGAINYFRTFPYWRLNINESYQVSTLLITGNKDKSVLIESIIQSTDFVEKFSLKVINNASHFPHQEQPDEVNKVLLNFLIGNSNPVADRDKPSNNGLVNRMFGAVSNTVKYGNSVLDVVQKRTNGLTARALGYDS